MPEATDQPTVRRPDDRPSWWISPRDITDRSTSPIGHGGFGQVFTGTYFGSKVAIKQLFATPKDHELTSFHSEIGVWQSLSHPHILPLLGVCVPDDAGEEVAPLIVSPFMPNGTLCDYVAKNTVALEEKLRLLYQVASALDYLHTKEIIHGDLRATNILLDGSFQAVVTDFGLSRTRLASSLMDPSRSNSAIGATDRYKAPEMLDTTTSLTTKADVYAFAVTMYEVLNNGVPVWVSDQNLAVQAQTTKSTVCNAQRPYRLDGIPNEIWSIIESCWHQNPAKRP
ncbi:kinase-like domain-containing protein, partial [Polychytrium aggregatum]|uniref:kinase-like domain-containing protein n=1 Tax=Polychytrium aggregatum TaxID=110093 RepID=UPI0022FE8700